MTARDKRAKRRVWAAVAVVPPAGLGLAGALLEQVRDNLAAVVAIGAVYEAVLVVVATVMGEITAGVMGDLVRRYSERLVNWIDPRLVSQVSGFGRRYRRYLLARLRFIDQKGLATISWYPPEHDEVFVDVSLSEPLPGMPVGLLGGASRNARRDIWDFLGRPKPVPMVVIGAAGSGKTMLLWHLARQVCRSRRRPRKVPVLLYLRDHSGEIVAGSAEDASEPPPDAPSLPEVALRTFGPLTATMPDEWHKWLERQLVKGRCLVLLDGLDEVARRGDRQRVARWIEQQIRDYPYNDYVVTARPHGYRTARVDGAAVLQIREFTREQVEQFVHRWYVVVERFSTSAGSKTVNDLARQAAEDLLGRLSRAPALEELTVNPLLLTMIANVHRYRGALPGSRAELYDEICQVLLWRLHEARRLRPTELRGDQRMVLLRELAFTMMQRRVRDLPKGGMLGVITATLSRVATTVSAEDFLGAAAASGLLVERESGEYTFAHQTFQEYLAAIHIRDRNLVSVLTEAVGSPWWRETTLLYVARTYADPIVEECLKRDDAAALALAFDCADQARELAPQLRDRLDALLAGAQDPATDPERRRLMAGVITARSLRHLVKVDGGGRISPRPISARTYRLFLRDMEARGDHRAPDTPDSVGGSFGGDAGADTDAVALGVRGSDAVAFVEWLNERVDDERVYRLPTRTEVEDFAARHAPGSPDRSVWTAPAGDRAHPDLWSPPGMAHPHAVDAPTLRQHLQTDLHKPPLLPALLLTQSHIRLSHLLDDIGHASANLDVANPHPLAEDLIRAKANADHLAGAGAPAHNLASALDLVRELSRCVDSAYAHAHSRAQVPDTANVRAIAHATACRTDLSHARDLALELTQAVRSALSESLSGILEPSPSPRTAPDDAVIPPEGFPDGNLVQDVTANLATLVVAPDALAGTIESARSALERLRDGPGRRVAASWAAATACELEAFMRPVVTRQRPLDPDAAGTIRVAALSLDAQTAHLPLEHEFGLERPFQEVAAGITLLERRHRRQAPATEAILVAVD